MSLATPEKIRSLQRKLYRKAKAEPAFRFYVLYDKICREDILRHAYGLARANAGAPGVDGVSFAQIEAQGLEAWLAGLREELVSKTYRPDPVRRVMIPKPMAEASDRSPGGRRMTFLLCRPRDILIWQPQRTFLYALFASAHDAIISAGERIMVRQLISAKAPR